MHVHEITYDEVAAELGVSRPYVSMLLNGHRKPPDAKKRIEMAIDSIIARRAENG
nr:MAG TPA: Helix-turn-helix XRE-family like protein [Siphoviridae sp. ctqcj14]